MRLSNLNVSIYQIKKQTKHLKKSPNNRMVIGAFFCFESITILHRKLFTVFVYHLNDRT